MDAPTIDSIFYSQIDIQIRFNDLDAYRHVNNNSYFSYYDLGKDEYFREVFPSDFRLQSVVPIIANIKADFFSPIFYGDPIIMQTRCSHLGTKSFTLQQRAVNTRTGKVVCQAETIMVFFDVQTQKSAPIPTDYRKNIVLFERGQVE